MLKGLESKVCDVQLFAEARCAAAVLGNLTDIEAACKEPLEAPSPCGDEVKPRSATASNELQTVPPNKAILAAVLKLIGELIVIEESKLWADLQGPASAADQTAAEVKADLRRLDALRKFESRLATELGVRPQHQTYAQPKLDQSQLGNVTRNLATLFASELARLQSNREAARMATSVQEKQARKEDADDAAGVIAWLAIANRSLPPGSLQGLEELIAKLEKDIAGEFDGGHLATLQGTLDNEPRVLSTYRALRDLRAIRDALPKPKTPAQEVAITLKEKRGAAEAAYIQYVADPDRKGLDPNDPSKTAKDVFTAAVDAYAKALARFLGYDDRLQVSSLPERQVALVELLGRPFPTRPTVADVRAYRGYREELDKISDAINIRVGGMVDPKKPEILPRGIQVTRTLDQVVSCSVGRRGQLAEEEQELLVLADLWMEFGGKEAVVFRARSDSPSSSLQWLDCGFEPFAYSIRNRLPERGPSAPTNTFEPRYRTRSGLHVRNLTLVEIGFPKKDLMAPPDPTKVKLEGVLVQVPGLYEVVAVVRDAAGKRVLKGTHLMLPADDEFLDIAFKGGVWRSQELALAFHPTGAVSEYKVVSTQEVSNTAQSTADALKTITTTALEVEEAQQPPAAPSEAALLEAENNKLKQEILNMMWEANLAAIREGKALPYPWLVMPPD